jgi:hypothetical protein
VALSDNSSPEQKAQAYRYISDFLGSTATFCPLTSELVELKHGHVQELLHRFRSRRKAPTTAAERSFIFSVVREYEIVKEALRRRAMPSKTTIGKMVSKVGVSDPSFKGRWADTRSTAERIKTAEDRRPRDQCGWNVFQRFKMENESQLTTGKNGTYSKTVKGLSQEWKAMSTEDREAYEVEARFKNTCRRELEKRPLKPETEVPTIIADTPQTENPLASRSTAELEEIVGGRGAQKISFNRLKVNQENFTSNPCWKSGGLGLHDFKGALRADLIDVDTNNEDVASMLAETIHQPVKSLPEVHECRVHLEVCFAQYGQCQHNPLLQVADGLAKQFGRALTHHNISSGALFRLHLGAPLERDEFFFLGSQVKMPVLQVLAKAFTHNEVVFSLLESLGGVPSFHTSHQIFQRFLVSSDDPLRTISVEVLPFGLNPLCDFGLLQVELQAAVVQGPVKFVLESFPSRVVRPTSTPSTLPFGLKMQKKLRRTNKDRTAHKSSTYAQYRHRVYNQSFPNSDTGDVLPESSSSSSAPKSPSSSSSSSVSYGDVVEEVEGAGLGLPMFQETEIDTVVVPVPATDSTQEIQQLAVELQADMHHRLELADLHRSGQSSAQPVPPNKTFWVKTAGFDNFDFSKTGTSKCFHCTQPITKNSPRFCYWWHPKRPSRWVHDFCVIRLCEAGEADTQIARRSQAEQSFESLLEQSHFSPQARSAIQFTLASLRSQSTASSSSGV